MTQSFAHIAKLQAYGAKEIGGSQGAIPVFSSQEILCTNFFRNLDQGSWYYIKSQKYNNCVIFGAIETKIHDLSAK